jgi:hypothetical protein
MDWGIKKWPTITPWKKPKSFAFIYRSWKRLEAAGDDESSPQVEDQQSGQVAGQQAPRLMLRDPKKPSKPRRSKRAVSHVGTFQTPSAPTATLTDPATHPPTTPARLPNPPLPAASTIGHEQVSVITSTPIVMGYTDMLAFGRNMSQVEGSLVGMEVLRTELRFIMMRERSDAEAVIEKMKDRRLIWERLLDRVDDTIGSKREQSSNEKTEFSTGCEDERGVADHSAIGDTE